MGTAVIGYDGYGGRQYMLPEQNCRVAPYAQIERVAEMLIEAVNNPEGSARLAMRGGKQRRATTTRRSAKRGLRILERFWGLRPLNVEVHWATQWTSPLTGAAAFTNDGCVVITCR